MAQQCPYKVGDIVYYRPKGYEKIINQFPGGYPDIGAAVTITKIVDGQYIVYDGYTSPAGGIYWTEFSAT